MTKAKSNPTIDSDADTAIGLKGSEQHHDLKNKAGEAGDPNHTEKTTPKDSDAGVEDDTGGQPD